jgi:hypothetical protein
LKVAVQYGQANVASPWMGSERVAFRWGSDDARDELLAGSGGANNGAFPVISFSIVPTTGFLCKRNGGCENREGIGAAGTPPAVPDGDFRVEDFNSASLTYGDEFWLMVKLGQREGECFVCSRPQIIERQL